MVFYAIKTPLHQCEPDTCVPTTLKVVLQNQFNIIKNIATYKKWSGWMPGGVIPYSAIRGLDSHLEPFGVTVNEKSNLTEKDLIKLLEDNILPIIYFRMNYFTDANSNQVSVDEEGNKYYHPIVPIGVDNGKVYIYDCFMTGYGKSLPIGEVKVVMSIPQFLKEWQVLGNKAFWFTSEKIKNRKLSDFPEFKK